MRCGKSRRHGPQSSASDEARESFGQVQSEEQLKGGYLGEATHVSRLADCAQEIDYGVMRLVSGPRWEGLVIEFSILTDNARE